MKSMLLSRPLRYILLLVVVGIAGWLTPFLPVKSIATFVGIILFAMVLKSYGVRTTGFLVLSIVLFVVPFAVISSVQRLAFSQLDISSGFEILPMVTSKTVYPDRTIDGAEKLTLEISAVTVELVDAPVIEVPSKIDVVRSQNSLMLRGGRHGESYVIRVGTQYLEELFIDSGACNVKGSATLNLLKVDSIAVKLSANITARQIFIEGTGVNVDGEFSGKELFVNGTGIKVNGKYSFDHIQIDGTGVNVGIDLQQCKVLTVGGTAINGIIEYNGPGRLQINARGTGGTLTIRSRSHELISVEVSGLRIRRE